MPNRQSPHPYRKEVMTRRPYRYMSGYEKIGRAVTLPLRWLGFVLLIPSLLAAYPLVGLYIMVAGEGKFPQRFTNAVLWPVVILAVNDMLSLSGLDNPSLSFLGRKLDKLSGHFGRH